ncbi:MAG: TonB-dependent receptor plug domain-containing protein [Bacteroidales bacterium]|nr:TonB-dependent receptor plug domain-containing protein [Bacteroidales bacterium]
MKNKLLLTLLITASILFSLSAFKHPLTDPDYWLDYITSHFEEYISKYPQQKVYLQLDRDEYQTGSKIWYKAYVLNDTEKSPENRSKNLYIEMISPTKEVFMQQLLKIENGFAHGELPVLDTISTGLYSIRAFTRNMKNFGKDYLFKKDIRIIHPDKIYYSKEFYKKAKKVSKQDKAIDLQFFPEGGDFVGSLKTQLAFKAIDENGLGIDVEGQIYTKKGAAVASFKSSHLGMGKIDFEPAYGQKYYAVVKSEKGKSLKYQLPEVIEQGYNLNVSQNNNLLQVNISTNKVFGNDPVAKSVYLFIQNGGKIYSSGKHSFESGTIKLNIGKKIFPTGIIQLNLFDGHGIPQCERLAFINHGEKLDIKTNFDKKNIGKREKVEFDIEVMDEGTPVEAELSMSVRNKSQLTASLSKSTNIRNYFLLQSDLKGLVEDPEAYFDGSKAHQNNLDILMLTQGWRKFDWKTILKDSIPDPEFPVETDLRITGRITKYFFDISVKEAKVTLTLLNKFNDVFTDYSKEKGRFEFLNLDYSDTIDVLIEARTRWNRKNIMIIPDQDREIGTDFNPFREFYVDSLIVKRKIKHEPWKEPEKDPNVPEDFKLHSRADNVVDFKDPSFSSYSSVMDALKGRVPGLQVGNGGAMLRGPSSLLLSNEPLYLVDGMATDYNGIQSISVQDVDHVEILKGPSAAIYGMQGVNGVIAVYTKKGFYYKRGEIRFKMLGYHTPKKFYSPKYDANTVNNEKEDLRKTVYWNPSIKTDKNGKAHISFYQSDIVDDFEIIIEGMHENGKFGSYKYDYSVKELN